VETGNRAGAQAALSKTLLVSIVLMAGACTGQSTGPSSTSPTTTPPTLPDAPSTTAPPTTLAATTTTTEETTTTTAVRAPSTEAWGSWTLILASLEVDAAGSEERAEEIAAEIDGAMVLWSDDFPSLNPGYWVVYWGRFESGREASNWCSDLPAELTCYPRYLGSDVSPLAAAGHAILIDGGALVIVEVESGERRKMLDPYFTGDGRFAGGLELTPDGSVLYYDVGWEDSWYSCESSRSQVERLDLAFGTTTVVGPGFGPALSPDGRWMVLLVGVQCLPDPEQPDYWVLTPTDTVVLYDLESGRPVEQRRWSVAAPPVSYEDPTMLTWVDWRADSETLLVANHGGSIFEIGLNHEGSIDGGDPILEGVRGFPQALIGETLYVVLDPTPEEWGGFDLIAVDLATGTEGEVITQEVGWAYAAADTTRTRLIWGSDTGVGTAGTMFRLENYLYGLAW